MNIREIARRAQVSPSTVSRVLNGTKAVGSETKERVLRAVDESGYTPNSMKRHEQALALVIPHNFATRSAWASATLDGVMDGAVGTHVVLMREDDLYGDDRTEPGARVWLDRQRRLGLKGVVLVASPNRAAISHDLREAKIPYVIFGRGDAHEHWIWCDNVDIIQGVVDRLYQAGHRRIGFVGRGFGLPDHDDRIHAYRRAIAAYGLSPHEWLDSLPGMEQLAHTDTPTALFLADAHMAVNMLKRLSEAGVQIPADLSVVAMGHSPVLQAWQPRLSLVERRLAHGATLAAQTLLQLADHKTPPSEPIQIILPSDLTPGTSIGPPSHMP